jgi:prepilin-type N-terminal cleavage/methylation domain-containing protein
MKKYRGYSLIEVLVTLGIIAILVVMLFNVILIALRSNTKIAGRSYVREQVSTLLSQMTREIRNAEVVIECAGTGCDYTLNGKDIIWQRCNTISMCRYENGQLSFQTSDTINVNSIAFDSYPGTSGNQVILITITVAHTNAALSINNVISQVSTSTRNYE